MVVFTLVVGHPPNLVGEIKGDAPTYQQIENLCRQDNAAASDQGQSINIEYDAT